MWYSEGNEHTLSETLGYYNMKALLMHWGKRHRWKASIALAGILLILVLMAWVPVSAAGAYEGASGLATSVTGTMQSTPTEDATVTELNKEKLAEEVQQLKNQNASDPLGWLRTNASIFLSTLIVVIGALFGFWQWSVGRRDAQNKELEDRKAERERRDEEQKRWLEDRQAERERRAEERFQAVVEGLGSEREEARVGAAITLRTFLLPGYEQFYRQVFDLAVAHLRLRGDSKLPEDENIPLPLTSLSQALIVVFKEAFPLARRQFEGSLHSVLDMEEHYQYPGTTGVPSLDATGIHLDEAYLRGADLKQVRMPQASLREADLKGASLNEANLYKAKLCEASLTGANLSRAILIGANLSKAWFRLADLSQTRLDKADLTEANLERADLRWASLREVNLEAALSLKDTDLRGVKGLTEEQLKACKAKGAIIDEAPAPNSSQSPVSPSPPPQSSAAQASSAPFVQGSTPLSNTGGSSTPSTQQGSES